MNNVVARLSSYKYSMNSLLRYRGSCIGNFITILFAIIARSFFWYHPGCSLSTKASSAYRALTRFGAAALPFGGHKRAKF